MSYGHFVLVHTTCHGAWVWYKLKPMLEAAGHRVTTIDLAASGIDPKTMEQVGSLDDYIEPLLKVMDSIVAGEKVILVGDSCAGIYISIAADGYPDKVAAAVFHNALMPDTEHKSSYVLDKFLSNPLDWGDCEFSDYQTGNKETVSSLILGHKFMRSNIYNLCPVEDYELAKMLTRKGSLFPEDMAKRKSFSKEGYGSVKRVYIFGEEDQIFTREFHLWQIENNKPDKVYSIPGGDHKLMLSKTKEFCDCLQEIAATYA